MVVLRATRQKRDLLVDGRKNASEQDKLWRQNGLCSQGVAAKGPLPEGIPGSNTGYWAGKSIG
jgi:hypothetical protein